MLHAWIRTERENAGLTQVQMAGRLDVTQVTVSHIETGKNRITVDLLQRLSLVIGFDLEDAVRQKVTPDSPVLGSSNFTRKSTEDA